MGGVATWTNWAGNVSAHPVRVERPTTPGEVAAALARAAAEGLRVRPVGSGHSFTPLAATDGVLLDLSAMTGLAGVDDATGEVWVRAGTTLAQLNALLAARGRALANLGDIDRQALAGAIATGTHGTGRGFGGLATFVRELEIVTPADGVVRCSPAERPDLFAAATVGLGAFGVVTAVRLATVPAFRVRAVERPEPLADVLADLDGFRLGADHAEFFWFPYTDRALTKRNTRLAADDPARADLPGWRRRLDDEFMSNTVFGVVTRAAARRPALTRPVNAISARALSAREFVAPSHEVFVSPRRVRFRESEYAVPVAALPAVLAELRARVETLHTPVTFPVEVRFAAADDVWLSTGYQRENAYVAVHQHVDADHREYFAAFEAIVAAHAGRPHWGKMHTLGAAEFARLYPRFGDAARVRATADPGGLLLNDHLAHVFGA